MKSILKLAEISSLSPLAVDAPIPLGPGSGVVDDDSPAVEFRSIQFRLGNLGAFRVTHLDEAKTASLEDVD
jgi:hypothetical protein